MEYTIGIERKKEGDFFFVNNNGIQKIKTIKKKLYKKVLKSFMKSKDFFVGINKQYKIAFIVGIEREEDVFFIIENFNNFFSLTDSFFKEILEEN